MENPLERAVVSYVNQLFVLVEGSSDVASAVKAMETQKADTIIVTTDGTLTGIVTDTDILDKVVIKGEESDRIVLKSIMSSPIIALNPKSTVRQALELMRRYKIKRVLVIENDQVIGLVTQKILADNIRTSVLERTFKKYRSALRTQYRAILGNLGLIMQFAGILMMVPALVGTALGEAVPATGIYLEIVALFASGFVLNTYGERTALNLKQASVLVISSFILLGFFGSIPYMYLNPFYPGIPAETLVVNSFFESVSGFTTTGMSTLAFPENLPQSFIFYRSYTQWVGGLSFIYLIMRLFYPEERLATMKGIFGGSIMRFKQMLITISVIFTAYTIILILLLYAAGQTNVINNVSVIFSAVTGGGFVPSSTFVSNQNAPALFIIGAGMIISALPFAFHYSVFNKSMRLKTLGSEVFVYFILIVSFTLIFLALSDRNLLSSAFHVISASTNTGFQFIDIRFISPEAKLTLMIVMMIGGTAFSTAGGIKVGRLLLIYQRLTNRAVTQTPSSISSVGAGAKSLVNDVTESRLKHDRDEENLVKRFPWLAALYEKDFRESLLVIALFVTTALVSGFSLALLNSDTSVDNAIFESVSALTTTGIGTGMVTMQSDLASKLILSANMIAGRFEIIALLYIFFSSLRR